MRGLSNEHTQAGIEIIGFPVHQALEEAVISAKEALDAAVSKITSLSFHMLVSCNSFLKN